jgi:hypothetical protein
MTDPRHNPKKALELIKAAHSAGGRPADPNLIENARSGWVQRFKPNEMVVTRNGKTGFRSLGIKNGPLRNMSFLERRLQQQELAFTKLIARLENRTAAVVRLAAHRQKACCTAAAKRAVQASQIEEIIANLYVGSRLQPHNRASAITKQLRSQGLELTVRRVRQIVSAKISLKHKKSGNDRD